MTNLLDLPTELIAHVFQYLADHDVFAARRSNKKLEEVCFVHFGKRFFRKKGFMITTPSLQVLQSIAEHQGLNRYVQHVWFNPDCYTFVQPDCCPDYWYQDLHFDVEPEIPPTSEAEWREGRGALRSVQFKAYQECMADHNRLLLRDRLEGILARVFANLPNLQTIGMRRSEDYSPWGWKSLDKNIGQDPRVLGPIPSGPVYGLATPTKLFTAIIGAVAETNVSMKRLYTDAIEIDNITAEELSHEKLQKACSSLLYVEVNAVKAWLHLHRDQRRRGEAEQYNTLSDPADFGSGLARLFAATTQLIELGLQIFPDRRQSHLLPPRALNPDTWRQSYPYMALAKLTEHASLQHLTRVKLEKVASSSSVLQAFLLPCAARLTSLKLRDIRLLSSEDDEKPWKTLFSFLCANCRDLEYILFYHLMYDGGGVSFVKDLPDPGPTENENYLINLVPNSHGGRAVFMKYDHITLEEVGKDAVQARLTEVIEQHWYHRPLFSYAMDDELWHTDTSDEDW